MAGAINREKVENLTSIIPQREWYYVILDNEVRKMRKFVLDNDGRKMRKFCKTKGL